MKSYCSVFIGLGIACLTSVALAATDAPVAVDPLKQVSPGYMFDWIFFAIMIPIPLFMYLDMIRSRRP